MLQNYLFDWFTKPIGFFYNGVAEAVRVETSGKQVMDLHTHSSEACDEGVSPLASEIRTAADRGLIGLASTPHQTLRYLGLLVHEALAAEEELRLERGDDYRFYFIPGKETSNRLDGKRAHVSSLFFVEGAYTKELISRIIWFSETKLADLLVSLPDMLVAQEDLNNGYYTGLDGVKVIVYPTHVNSPNGFKDCLKRAVCEGCLDDLIAVHYNSPTIDDLRFFKKRGVSLIGGSDAHDKYKLGYSRTVFDTTINSPLDAFYAIKDGRVHAEQLSGIGSVKYSFLSETRYFMPQWWPKLFGMVFNGLAKLPKLF